MNLYNMVWTNWRSVPPPRGVVVISRYNLDDDRPSRVRTCKHGCCVEAGYGSMILPAYWAPTDDQTSALGWFELGALMTPALRAQQKELA